MRKREAKTSPFPDYLPWDPSERLPVPPLRPVLASKKISRRQEIRYPRQGGEVGITKYDRIVAETETQEKSIVIKIGAHPKSAHTLDLRSAALPLLPPASSSRRARRPKQSGPREDLSRLAPPARKRFRWDELFVVSFAEVVGFIIYRVWAHLAAFFMRAAEMVAAVIWPLHDRITGEEGEVEELGRARRRRDSSAPPIAIGVARNDKKIKVSGWHIPVFGLEPGFARALASFVFLLIISLLPMAGLSSLVGLAGVKSEIIASGRAGEQGLLSAESHLVEGNVLGAAEAFSRSAQSFATTEEQIRDAESRSLHLGSLLPGTRDQIRTVKALAALGSDLSRAGEIMTRAYGSAGTGILDRIQALEFGARAVLPLLRDAAREGEKIDSAAIPAAERDGVRALQDAVRGIAQGLQNLPPLASAAEELLGKSASRRYLVLFQNQNELRATGGFIGSFAEITIDRGEIRDIRIPGGGSYDLQGDQRARVRAPEPLRLVSARWHFHDANWFADFPASAAKIAWFYEKGNGPTVDGVIALGSGAVQDLLRAVGPVAMPSYGREINAENFVDETQKIVEIEYDKKENRPKQFIADLAPVLLERIKTGDEGVLRSVVSSLGKSLRTKQILIWSRDQELETLIKKVGWGGEIKGNEGNYLQVVDTNIAGQKTDAVISEEVTHVSEIQDSGAVIDTVTIRRTHHGVRGALFTGVRNVDYLRVYVPLGSDLLESRGDFKPPASELFEKPDETLSPDEDLQKIVKNIWADLGTGTIVGEESGRTTFGNWLQLDPGETVTATFRYRLPFRVLVPEPRGMIKRVRVALGGPLTTSYTHLVQKQAGTHDRTYAFRLVLPEGVAARFAYPSRYPFMTDDAVPVPLEHDLFYGAVLGR